MKRLDDSTLETVAETICGSGSGVSDYSSPGPYRPMSEIKSFFSRSGVMPRGESQTRKWFTLESLKRINGTPDLERVLLRLADPKEYRTDPGRLSPVLGHLNAALLLEGLELHLENVTPRLRSKTAAVPPAEKPGIKRENPPDFNRLAVEPVLAAILKFRWDEAQRCVEAGAYLAAIVMMGSILEGALLHKVETNLRTANSAKAAPKDKKTGQPRPIQDWGISGLIDVAHEVGWLQGDMKRFSHALRESRNLVHPYMQRAVNETPDLDTCAICWQVVRAGIADLLCAEGGQPGASK